MIEAHRLRDLLKNVPHRPDEPLPSGVGNDQCDRFSARTGIALPDELREWLKLSNGPCVGPGGLYGIETYRKHLDIEMYLALFPSWRTKGWIPIAGDGCGNHYVVATRQEYGEGFPVLFVDCGNDPESPAFIAASSIGHFLKFLLEKELRVSGGPFDEVRVVQADPEIRRFQGVAPPWEDKR